MSFSSVNDEQLVDFVSKNPALFDANVPGYKDSYLRDNLWREISATLHKTEEDCKKRWKSLRDSFIRCKHKEKKCHKPTSWHLYDRLLFLNNVVSIRTKDDSPVKLESNDASNDHTSLDEGNDSTNDAPTSLSQWPVGQTNSRKRNHEDFNEMVQDMKVKRETVTPSTDNDANSRHYESVETFGEHVKAVLKSLPHAQFVWAKAEMFNILTKYELENIDAQQFAPSERGGV